MANSKKTAARVVKTSNYKIEVKALKSAAKKRKPATVKKNKRVPITAEFIYKPTSKGEISVEEMVSVIKALRNINNDISRIPAQRIVLLAKQGNGAKTVSK